MLTTNLGFPNVYGSHIKRAVEGFWREEKSIDDVVRAYERVVAFNEGAQAALDLQPVFDIDIYDRMLRTTTMLGIVPSRFGSADEINKDLRLYLSIPRGTFYAQASPMVKWFSTNYHVVQPEIEHDHFTPYPEHLPPVPNGKKLALIGP